MENPERSPFPLAKIMLTGAPEEIARVQSFLKGRETPLHFLPTDGCFLELLAPEVDKGTGLMRLAQRLGVAPEHVYAAGDGYNDVEMLRAARLAFVPEDGDSAALACAGKRIPSCQKTESSRPSKFCRKCTPRDAKHVIMNENSSAKESVPCPIASPSVTTT